MSTTSRAQRDFTQGSIPMHLLLFSLPMFAGNLLQLSHSMANTVMVGQFIGTAALGAVAASFPLVFALLSLVLGITMATSTLVSQYRGARQEEKVKRTIGTSMILLSGAGIFVSVIGVVFRYPLLDLIQAPAELREYAAEYLGVFMAGMLGMFLFNTLSAILRGVGDSKTPLRYMVVSSVANIVLDYIFIVGLGPIPSLGIAGAAWATVISQTAAAIGLLLYMAKNTDLMSFDRSFWQYDGSLAKQILKIGLPAGFQQVLVSMGMLVISIIINSYGADIVAAYGAAQRFDQLAWMPAMTMGLAVSALVGQNLGAGKHDRVKAIVRWSMLLSAAITAVVGAVAILNPTILMRLFTDDVQVLQIGSDYLRVMGWTYVPMTFLFVLAGVMRGAGDTMPAMIMTVLSLWGVRVPLCWYLSERFGIQGVWWGIFGGAVIGAIMHWGYFVTGRWQRNVTAPVGKNVAPGAAGEVAAAPE